MATVDAHCPPQEAVDAHCTLQGAVDAHFKEQLTTVEQVWLMCLHSCATVDVNRCVSNIVLKIQDTCFKRYIYLYICILYLVRQKISPGAEVWAAAVSNEWTIDLFFSLISLLRFCAMMVHWVIIDLFGSSGSIGKK